MNYKLGDVVTFQGIFATVIMLDGDNTTIGIHGYENEWDVDMQGIEPSEGVLTVNKNELNGEDL